MSDTQVGEGWQLAGVNSGEQVMASELADLAANMSARPSPEEKTRMHTQNINVKTAAQESSRKTGEKTGAGDTWSLTRAQLRDLLLYIGDNSEKQQQPAFYVPPDNAQITVIRSSPLELQIVLCMVDGWPEAIAAPEAGYLAVLTGIPL